MENGVTQTKPKPGSSSLTDSLNQNLNFKKYITWFSCLSKSGKPYSSKTRKLVFLVKLENCKTSILLDTVATFTELLFCDSKGEKKG